MDEAQNAVVDLVLGYAREKTQWENAMYNCRFESKPEGLDNKHNEFFKTFDPGVYKGLGKEQIREMYVPLFERYTTPKKRAYSGKPTSFGYPAQFQGFEREMISEVNTVNKNRIEVIATMPYGFKKTYKFVALQKQGQWLLDSLKAYNKSEGTWRSDLL